MSTERLIVGPFNRVEGDLEVHLDISDGVVQSARVNAPMYRGFETLLLGRDPHDALVVVPRICGICSVSQSVAAARALAGLQGVHAPPNGQLATNLMLAVENAADHLTHFYLFFLPDFTREVYADRPWHAEAVRRFAALQGEHARQAVAARARWFEILGRLGGKWPHTEAIVAGGSSRAIDAADARRIRAQAREFRGVLERLLIGDRLEALDDLTDPETLQRWRRAAPGQGDLRFFLDLADDLKLDTLGLGPGRYLSHGAYPQADGRPCFAAGVLDADDGPRPVELAAITEDTSHAWYVPERDAAGQALAASPADAHTRPDADRPGAYSWAKAPRLAGRTLETGALARQLVDGHPLLRALARDAAGSGADGRALAGHVGLRVLARVLEMARIVREVEVWVTRLEPSAPYVLRESPPLPDGRAVGLTEAARGALSHWLGVDGGRISHYQIVAPTTWNFSPRDASGQPGPLEAALVGTPVRPGERTPVAVQHVVRSFDPCMVCTVH